MDNGTMKDYLEDLIIKVNDACKAMEEAEMLVAGLRAEVEHWKNMYQQTLLPKDIWHDCSHCQGHEPESLS
jgi:hypothetical protein